MEIERKFLIKDLHSLPFSIEAYPHRELEQAYLCTGPVVRIRKDDEQYFLTYKSKGLMIREEYNLPLNRQAYLHLREKADGKLITKRRYLIPFGKYTIELDLFSSPRPDLMLAEVEFSSEEEALAFKAPDWFGEDVTSSSEYHNSTLSQS